MHVLLYGSHSGKCYCQATRDETERIAREHL
jgi:hypothetical protein